MAPAPIRRALHTVQGASALAAQRPDFEAGLRAALATVVPLVAATVLHLGEAGTWMSLVGFTCALSDRGGPHRSRAATMIALTIASAAAIAVAFLAQRSIVLAVGLTLVAAFSASVARVWGNRGIGVGGGALSAFVIALAFPAVDAREMLIRIAYAGVGGAWAMVVALVLWPTRPYRAARLSVAAAYRALADFVDDVRLTRSSPAYPSSVGAVRTALENARATLARARRRGPGVSARGERLLVLEESVDQVFGHVVAIAETMDSVPLASRDPETDAIVAATLAALANDARAIADAIVQEHGSPRVAIGWRGDDRLRNAATENRHVATILDRAAQYASVAAETVAGLNSGQPTPRVAGRLPSVADEPDDDESPWAPLRDVLASDSLVLRHALRVAVVTSVAVALSHAFDLARGYWVTITIIVILQPYTGATTHRALQRVAGTVVGGLLTALLGAYFHDVRAILVLAFVFVLLCVALMPMNYALFSVFLTPTFVLLAEASAGDWHLAGLRIVNTLIGGALALAGGLFLWPSPETDRLNGHLAAAVRANAAYLRRALALFDDRSDVASQQLRAARREIGLAAVNAEESFQRLVVEHGGREEDLAPVMAFLTYTRRLTASVAALALARHSAEPRDADAVPAFAAVTNEVLRDLEQALVEDRPPRAMPDLRQQQPWSDTLSPLVAARVDRVARQLRTLHDAVERWQTHA